MTQPCRTLLLWTLVVAGHAWGDVGNPQIDYKGFAEQVVQLEKLREARRISETEFQTMARDPVTIILDARSKEKFDLLHIKGARNLSLPDMTAGELAKIIPTKTTRVLIYCNNNFKNEENAFPTKRKIASLNLYTFNSLHSYGYTNVYELRPVLDVKNTVLPFEGSTTVSP